MNVAELKRARRNVGKIMNGLAMGELDPISSLGYLRTVHNILGQVENDAEVAVAELAELRELAHVSDRSRVEYVDLPPGPFQTRTICDECHRASLARTVGTYTPPRPMEVTILELREISEPSDVYRSTSIIRPIAWHACPQCGFLTKYIGNTTRRGRL